MRRVCVTSELGTVWQIRILVPKGLEARDFSRVSVHIKSMLSVRGKLHTELKTFVEEQKAEPLN